ncbi:hypothetical protein [Aureispira anguillae]|uniref:Uncharacterized protein n=1 Tax=Aureispira anguillae TaxID=2864201 RepID=A0A916DX89_9BACT|nr:hypothetical protein [Aureispira anguillae]BDS14831.1 hypothetical protein AsAng_0056130 [Aureispira anguillae]
MEISKKKPSFPISDNLRKYLKDYGRSDALPIQYQDLTNWYESAAIYDQNGNDTLWEAIIYHPTFQDEIEAALTYIYGMLKTDGNMEVIEHLRVSRIDYCLFGNSKPFRIRIINSLNDNHDYFYIKKADASRVYGLELEDILSPNRLAFIVDKETLVEEHIPGIPGDAFLDYYIETPNFLKSYAAKEFVKFNERCFVMLLGDMRSYNYVVDVTPDFDKEQYRVRAIDFDQLCYEGRKNHYLPQFYKENYKIVKFCMEVLPPITVEQYKYEERILMKKRYNLDQERIKHLLNSMSMDTLSTHEKRASLIKDLNSYHTTQQFSSLSSMGEILTLHLELMLGKPMPKTHNGTISYKKL